MSSAAKGWSERRAPVELRITDASYVGEARRRAQELAGAIELTSDAAGRLAIVVTEVVSNIVKHAGEGDVVLAAVTGEKSASIQILASDHGPGIVDVEAAIRDGHSTAGTAGTGLGAIVRLADAFDIYSEPNNGTMIFASISRHRRTESEPCASATVGAVWSAKRGEEVSGDSWAFSVKGKRVRMMVADGLGHGPLAADAAQAAIEIFEELGDDGPSGVLTATNDALRSTRGAAVAIADIDISGGKMRYAGVGNISGVVVQPAAPIRNMISMNGTVGASHGSPREFFYDAPKGSLVILHSDGVATHWKLENHPGLASRHPALIAGVLFRNYARGRDDATVLVARIGGE